MRSGPRLPPMPIDLSTGTGRNSFRALAGEEPAPNPIADRVNATGRLGGPLSAERDDEILRLPEEAARRLNALRNADADIAAVLRSISDERAAAFRRKAEAVRDLKVLTDPLAASAAARRMEQPGSPAVQAVEARIAAAAEEIADLGKRMDAHRARRSDGLMRNVEDWLSRLLPRTVIELHEEPIEVPKFKAGGVMAALDAARETIARVNADCTKFAAQRYRGRS
jgi:hypothetical protein